MIEFASSWRRSEYQLFAFLVLERKDEVEFRLSQPTLPWVEQCPATSAFFSAYNSRRVFNLYHIDEVLHLKQSEQIEEERFHCENQSQRDVFKMALIVCLGLVFLLYVVYR